MHDPDSVNLTLPHQIDKHLAKTRWIADEKSGTSLAGLA